MTPSGCRSRSLNAVKVRYLDRRRTAASCSVSFQIVISSTSFPLESGCKITHFFAFSNFYPHFFQFFCKKIHKILCFRYVLRQVFRNKGKGAGRGTQYIITRVQVRARLVRAKKIRNGENSCRMGRKIFWKDGILYRMTRKKSGNTPRGREKIFVRTENSFRKMRIFPLKSPGKSAKMMKTGRKISFPARGKT